MPLIPRLVVPGYPHHVTQRGNRRQKTFFHARDYLAYLEFIAAAKPKARCDIWAYCLMPNHIHFVMDEQHLNATVRYVELNPVPARLCASPQDRRWSSVHAHLDSNDDELVSVMPMLERFPNWAAYLGDRQSNTILRKVRKHTKTGRPLGSGKFIETLESITGRSLKPLKPGRKQQLTTVQYMDSLIPLCGTVILTRQDFRETESMNKHPRLWSDSDLRI
jgi:putative transposase